MTLLFNKSYKATVIVNVTVWKTSIIQIDYIFNDISVQIILLANANILYYNTYILHTLNNFINEFICINVLLLQWFIHNNFMQYSLIQ